MRKIFGKIILTLIFLLSLLLFIPTLHAEENSQSASSSAQKYGITFPIAELGNCNDITACKAYCGLEANKEACTSYAQKKGFYRKPEATPNPEMLQAAKTELGCDSYDACKLVCSNPDNQQKCSDFAKKHSLGSPPKSNVDILQKAKAILGCDSESACRAFCSDPANQQKCSDFAKQVGINGGTRKVGPGGCSNEESCRVYCQTHMDECRQFGGKPGFASSSGERRAPEGSDSGHFNTMDFCKINPDKCGPRPTFNPSFPPPSIKPFNTGSFPPNFTPPANFQPPPKSDQVQGVSTERSLIQVILDWFR